MSTQISLSLPNEFTELLEEQVQAVYLEAIHAARADVGVIREYLSIEEVCKMMDISRNTLNNWFELKLPKYRIGNKQYVKKSELNKFVSQHQVI